jgi:hypothetical protein
MDFPRRDPQALQADAPYSVRFPSFERYVTHVRLPGDGAGFEIVGKDVDFKLSAMAVRRTSRIEDGVLIVEQDEQTLAPELPAEEARGAATRAEPTGITENVYVRAPRRLRATAPKAKTDALAADRRLKEASR